MSIIKKYVFLLACIFFSVYAWGQAARSPFTTFGIGEPYGSALVNAQGMAGVGVSQPQFWYLNNQNPALLVYNNLTVFQAGMMVESRTIKGDTISEKGKDGNMNYLVTAFPIKPTRWTTSLGLMPYTTVKYKFQYETEVKNSTDISEVIEEGSGGLTQLYWSNGVRLNKNFAVGLKASYIFSSIINTYQNRLQNSPQPINAYVGVQERTYVKDFTFAAGASYSKDSLFSQKKYRLSAGAVYNFAADLNTRQRNIFFSTLTGIIDDDPNRDTLRASKGHIHIPGAITAGISLSRGAKWTVGTEFTYQDWSSFRSVSKDDEGLGESWRMALGGEITPDLLDPRYFKRVTYRLGGSMEQYPFLANNKTVKDVGINFGLSLPAGRSSLDLAFKLGKRGNKADNILEESYFKVYFGITFNDQWFVKRKFD
jgi:hypothetical protein